MNGFLRPPSASKKFVGSRQRGDARGSDTRALPSLVEPEGETLASVGLRTYGSSSRAGELRMAIEKPG
jgi:hypothetical protein